MSLLNRPMLLFLFVPRDKNADPGPWFRLAGEPRRSANIVRSLPLLGSESATKALTCSRKSPLVVHCIAAIQRSRPGVAAELDRARKPEQKGRLGDTPSPLVANRDHL